MRKKNLEKHATKCSGDNANMPHCYRIRSWYTNGSAPWLSWCWSMTVR